MNTSRLHIKQYIYDLVLDCDLRKKENFQSITIDINTNKDVNEDIKTSRNLNQILNDIELYRNQLYNEHGSIHIQACSSQSKRCCCNHNQSVEICRQIFEFEKELFQNDFVEYIYKIESMANKKITLI
jgi:hypothetical protein